MLFFIVLNQQKPQFIIVKTPGLISELICSAQICMALTLHLQYCMQRSLLFCSFL